jgi:hypothetical protein
MSHPGEGLRYSPIEQAEEAVQVAGAAEDLRE